MFHPASTQALAEASYGTCDDKAIQSSCTGLFLFGVPNRGFKEQYVSTMVSDPRHTRFLDNLKEGSELLRHIYHHFMQEFKFSDTQITSFYELEDSKALVVGPLLSFCVSSDGH